jgi:hypothetical protein
MTIVAVGLGNAVMWHLRMREVVFEKMKECGVIRDPMFVDFRLRLMETMSTLEDDYWRANTATAECGFYCTASADYASMLYWSQPDQRWTDSASVSVDEVLRLPEITQVIVDYLRCKIQRDRRTVIFKPEDLLNADFCKQAETKSVISSIAIGAKVSKTGKQQRMSTKSTSGVASVWTCGLTCEAGDLGAIKIGQFNTVSPVSICMSNPDQIEPNKMAFSYITRGLPTVWVHSETTFDICNFYITVSCTSSGPSTTDPNANDCR